MTYNLFLAAWNTGYFSKTRLFQMFVLGEFILRILMNIFCQFHSPYPRISKVIRETSFGIICHSGDVWPQFDCRDIRSCAGKPRASAAGR